MGLSRWCRWPLARSDGQLWTLGVEVRHALDAEERLHVMGPVHVTPHHFPCYRRAAGRLLGSDQRVALARLLVRTIYGHLHATQQRRRDGDSIGFQFYVTTSSGAAGVAQPTASITVNA